MKNGTTLTRDLPDSVKASAVSLGQQAEATANTVTLPATRNLRLGDFVRQTAKGAAEDQLLVFAGNLTFRSLLAIFPALVALLWLMTALHTPGLLSALLRLAGTALPHDAFEPIRLQLTNPPAGQAGGAVTLGAVVGCGVTLWALSSWFRAIMQAMNVIYRVREGRPWWKRQLIAVLLSLAITGLLLGALLLVVFSQEIAQSVALGPIVRWAWTLVLWPVIGAGVLAAFALTYYFAPDCRQQFRWISRGAVTAVVLWLLFTLLFALYVNHLASYSKTYGALAGITIFMLYLYYGSFILLLGAEMNQVIEADDPAGKDAGERTPHQATDAAEARYRANAL
jgi:membrane protein